MSGRASEASEAKLCERLVLFAAPLLMDVLRTARDLRLPDWLVFSGEVYQPVLNHLTGRPSYYGVKDYDLAYFDGADCMSIRQLASDEAEWRIRAGNSRAVRRR